MTVAIDRPIDKVSPDKILTLQGDWSQFKLIQQGCAGTRGARLFYFDGTIEILMPSKLHEVFSQLLGYLLTCFLTHQDVEFLAMGSTDQEKEGEAAAQPDQSYCIGTIKSVPDLAIEVVFTSGGKRKLLRYETIGIPEVWFWQDGVLTLYRLGPEGYGQIQQSELDGLRSLDLEVLKRHILMGELSTPRAVKSFYAYLQGLDDAGSSSGFLK